MNLPLLILSAKTIHYLATTKEGFAGRCPACIMWCLSTQKVSFGEIFSVIRCYGLKVALLYWFHCRANHATYFVSNFSPSFSGRSRSRTRWIREIWSRGSPRSGLGSSESCGPRTSPPTEYFMDIGLTQKLNAVDADPICCFFSKFFYNRRNELIRVALHSFLPFAEFHRCNFPRGRRCLRPSASKSIWVGKKTWQFPNKRLVAVKVRGVFPCLIDYRIPMIAMHSTRTNGHTIESTNEVTLN